MQFDQDDVEKTIKRLGLRLDKVKNNAANTGKRAVLVLTDALNALASTFKADNAPPLTLSPLQARAMVTLLAPGWAMHSVKIAAYEACAPYPQYAKVFGTKQAYAEIQGARQALAQINYVLSAVVELMPKLDKSAFLSFQIDPSTGVMGPMYNHQAAMMYTVDLSTQWMDIPLTTDPKTTIQ